MTAEIGGICGASWPQCRERDTAHPCIFGWCYDLVTGELLPLLEHESVCDIIVD